MMGNVTHLPPRQEPPDLLCGPFQVFHVVVEGRRIPRLTGFPDGDQIALVVDGRFIQSFAADDARKAAWLIAQALAIGEGYTHLGAEQKQQPFAPVMVQIATPSQEPRDE